jgi:lysozyme family protein
MNFETAFNLLVNHEGGYTCDTRDNGNWTGGKPGSGILKGSKYGISAYSYPELDIKNLTLDEVKIINRRDFWDCLSIDQLPDAIRFDLYSMAYQSCAPRQPIQAVKLLQRAYNSCSTGPDLLVDGKLGPKTIAAINSVDPQLLDKRFSGQILLFMADLKPSLWDAFGRGWARRIANNLLTD